MERPEAVILISLVARPFIMFESNPIDQLNPKNPNTPSSECPARYRLHRLHER